jgi:hypothetical protein
VPSGVGGAVLNARFGLFRGIPSNEITSGTFFIKHENLKLFLASFFEVLFFSVRAFTGCSAGLFLLHMSFKNINSVTVSYRGELQQQKRNS